MTGVRLGIGTEISIDERIFAVRRTLGEGLLQLESESDGEMIRLSRPSLAASIANGSARIHCTGGGKKRTGGQDLSALPERERAEVRRRLMYVRLVLFPEVPLSGAKLMEACVGLGAERLGDPNPPSVATLYNWCKAYKNAGKDPGALIPKVRNRGNRQRRLPLEVLEILRNVINERFLISMRPRPSDVYSAVVAEITRLNTYRAECDQLSVPTARTLYREIEKLDTYTFLEGRYGKAVADRETRHVSKGVTSTRPLERVEIDHTKMDIIVCDDEFGFPIGRPTLTIVLDHFTRLPLGYYIGFEPPSTASVMLAMRHAIRPKDFLKEKYPEVKGEWPCYGVPEVLVTDNGPEFHSNDLEVACAQLGIMIQHTRVKAPWTKGVVERFFGEISRSLLAAAPGKTFHKTDARAEYDSSDEATVKLSVLDKALCKWIVDVHARTKHEGIKDIPLERWNEGVEEFPPRLISSYEDLDVFLSSCRENRCIHPKGILLEGLWYNNHKLTDLRTSSRSSLRVDIKFDPMNLGSIRVLDPRCDSYFEVPAIELDYADGLGLWQHKVNKSYLKWKSAGLENPVTLAEAREEIHKMLNEPQKSRKKKTNARAARYREAGGIRPNPAPQIDKQTDFTNYGSEQETGIIASGDEWLIGDDGEEDDFLVNDMQRILSAKRG